MIQACDARGVGRTAALAVLLLAACACSFVPGRSTSPISPLAPSLTPSLTPVPPGRTDSPSGGSATFTPTPPATPTWAPPDDPHLSPDGVWVFPSQLAEGDQLSASVQPMLPPGAEPPFTMTLRLGDGTLFELPVEEVGLDGANAARFVWVAEVPEGQATLELTATLLVPSGADPNLGNNTVALALPVLSPEELLPPEPSATWAFTETAGFSLHYLTGSAAERDLVQVMDEATRAYSDVIAYLGESPDPVTVYLLDRVIGQGGYASGSWAAITYVDRNYSPVTLSSVLRHELTHHLQANLGCDGAPSLIQEGLAVFVAGGHYRAESISTRAAALLSGEYYIPLLDMVEGFYTQQHEVSYIEAGSLIDYIVTTKGWGGVEDLCRAVQDSEAEGQLGQFESGLKVLGFGSLASLEAAWLDWLSEVPTTRQDLYAFEVEIWLMDTMRVYQRFYDPAAHFLVGILFDPEEAVERDITANFVRRPSDPQAVALELLLAAAQEAVRRRDPASSRALVDIVQATLASGRRSDEGWDGIASDALAITRLLLEQGYDPFRLAIVNGDAYRLDVLDRQQWPKPRSFLAEREGEGWSMTEVTPAE